MPLKALGEISRATGKTLGIKEWEKGGKWISEHSFTEMAKDAFSPKFPEPIVPDPVAQQSTLAATHAEERSLINRAGLAGTKKVRSLLGKTDSLGGGGSGV